MEQKAARSGGANTAPGLTTTDPRRSVMANADPTCPPTGEQPSPIATIRGYRRTGGAVVTVCRAGRIHRYRVTLRRYALLRKWTVTHAAHHWRTSGWWGCSSTAVSLWEART